MKDESRDRLYTLFTGVIMLLVCVCGIVKFAPQYKRQTMLKEQDAERDARIRETERLTAEKRDLERRFNTDPECVQSVARENRLYHPREVVFLFNDQDWKR